MRFAQGRSAVCRSSPDFTCSQSIQICSGILLSPRLVVTVAHCVSISDSTIACATTTLGKQASPSDLWVTTDPHVRPEATFVRVVDLKRPGDEDTPLCGHDIALLRLDEPIELPRYAESNDEPALLQSADESFSVIGYGVDSADDELGASIGVRRTSSASFRANFS